MLPNPLSPCPFSVFRLLCLLWLVFLAIPGHGKKPDPDRLNRQIKQVTAEMQRLEGKKRRQEKALADLEREIGQIAAELRRLERKTRRQRQQRQRLAHELKRQQQLLQQQQRQLANLVRTAYGLGRHPPLQLLLNVDDPARASRMLIFYRYFNRSRLDRIRAIRQRLANIRQLHQKISATQQQLSRLVTRQKQQLARLRSIREQRQQLLDRIQSQLKNRKLHLIKLQQDQRQLKRLVQTVDSTRRSMQVYGKQSFHKRRHRLPWPVAGRLVTDFGSKRGTGRWEGVVIRAPEGTPVKAIHPGRVIFSGWMPGYGQLLIVRHDHHFMTLYAFNQTLLKDLGDDVSEGETIATVGRSGGRDRPGLYFAIRRGSQPVDPKHWCRRPRRGRVK